LSFKKLGSFGGFAELPVDIIKGRHVDSFGSHKLHSVKSHGAAPVSTRQRCRPWWGDLCLGQYSSAAYGVTATARFAADHTISPQHRTTRLPQFAVDLLEKTLFRLKWAVKGLDRRRRRAESAPLTAHFNRKRVFSKRSTANCGGFSASSRRSEARIGSGAAPPATRAANGTENGAQAIETARSRTGTRALARLAPADSRRRADP
jgi:hypothetical protein